MTPPFARLRRWRPIHCVGDKPIAARTVSSGASTLQRVVGCECMGYYTPIATSKRRHLVKTTILAVMLLVGGALTASIVRAEDGKALYDKKCKSCHSIAGDGGKFADKGGPLDGVGGKRDEAWLRAYFADPKSKIPDAKMPRLKLTPAEWDAIVAYMLTLK